MLFPALPEEWEGKTVEVRDGRRAVRLRLEGGSLVAVETRGPGLPEEPFIMDNYSFRNVLFKNPSLGTGLE